MPRNRYDHSCGLVIHPELGPELVVAGGYSYGYSDTVDIYTVDADSWREGNGQTKSFWIRKICNMLITANRLPKPISEAAVVPYDNSFFLVGGGNRDDGLFFEGIYQYNADNDEWIEMEAKLKTPRSDHVALLVQQSIFPKCF